MASFEDATDHNLTEPPSLGFSTDAVINWAGYVLVAAMGFIALAAARTNVAPAIAGVIESVTGMDLSNNDDEDLTVV